MDTLLSPYRIKNVELKNRVVMLPHVTFYGTQARTPSRRHMYYYRERAMGGVGLIVTESQYVHETSACNNCVDASNREGMLLWGDTIEVVHDYGTKIFAQLTHHSIEAMSAHSHQPMLAPSPIPDPTVGEIPKAMDADDMRIIRGAFRQSAANVRAAGFDGVELKVGHDGLLRAFLSPYFNRRADDYGGSRENRLRFVLEVLNDVRAEVGDDYVLGIRFCLNEFIPGGYTLDDALWYAAQLTESSLLDYISTDAGTWASVDMQVPPMTVPHGFALESVTAIKEVVDVPVIAFGRIKTPDQAEAILASGQADLIGMARQLITDPEWVNKAAAGRAEDIRPCVACNQECVGRLAQNLPIGCVHNPAAGHEEALGVSALVQTEAPKKVIVVGGGPMGLKAAELAAARGHRVTLFEKGDHLGGQIVYAARAPHHAEWGEIAAHLIHRVEALGVSVRLNTEATVETILAENPGAVVVATGSRPGPPPFAIKGRLPIFDEWQILSGEGPREQRVALLDMGVRFEGAALAQTLAERGNNVHWLAPTPTVGFEVDPPSLVDLRKRLGALETPVECMPETTILEVHDDMVLTFNVFSQQVSPLAPIDAVVIAGNKVSENALTEELRLHGVDVYSGGDAVAPRHVAIAIREGDRIGREI